MTGFQSPNYTQVPNDYFDLVMEMTTAENRVLAILLRSTFGYHRDEIKLSIRELARLTKLSPQSVMDGAKRLEGRLLIERTVSETRTTNWRVLINSDTKLYQKIVKTVSVGQYENTSLPLKKEKKKENDEVLATISRAYESEIGVLTPMIADELREASTAYPLKWTLDAIREAATQNKRGWKYALAILKRWNAQGNQEAMTRTITKIQGSTKQDQSLANIQSWLAKKQEARNG